MLAKTGRTGGGAKGQAFWRLRERLVPRGSAAYTTVAVARASNATVWDLDGRAYVDFAGGIGTLNVGHCHPRVVAALQEQSRRLLHTCFHVAAYPGYVEVCRRLAQAAPMPGPKKAALFNSGSEAVENAVKFARAYTGRRAVIGFDNAFHGRTLLCLTLDGRHKPLRQGLGPFAPEFYRARFPDPYRPPEGVAPEQLTAHCLEALERLLRSEVAPEEVAAAIVEPVQGEGGFVVPTPGFLQGLRRLCDRHGILLVIDEVQTGFGRTGRMFAIEHSGVRPDLMLVGKSLAAGMPLSGVVGRAEVIDAAPSGSIGGTYGGNPMSCAAALAVFDILEEERLADRARRIGTRVAQRFESLRRRLPFVGDARGLGAMRAVELVKDKRTKRPDPARTKAVLARCQAAGLIAIKSGPQDNVIRTLMPLTIADSDLERGLDILERALQGART